MLERWSIRVGSPTIVGILLTLGGCAASGPAFRQVDLVPEQKALVYVYRPNS
jgi:hypothetical protein